MRTSASVSRENSSTGASYFGPKRLAALSWGVLPNLAKHAIHSRRFPNLFLSIFKPGRAEGDGQRRAAAVAMALYKRAVWVTFFAIAHLAACFNEFVTSGASAFPAAFALDTVSQFYWTNVQGNIYSIQVRSTSGSSSTTNLLSMCKLPIYDPAIDTKGSW